MVNGLTQYKINAAKSYARNIIEAVHKIELMFQLAEAKMISREEAEHYISVNISALDEEVSDLQAYLKPKEVSE